MGTNIVQDNLDRIDGVIKSLRDADVYISHIYLKGGCYSFHLFLKSIYPHARAYINDNKNHIATMISGVLFDITGMIKENDYYKYEPLQSNEIEMVSSWSFYRGHVLQLCECPHCEEPILYDEIEDHI